MTKTKNRFWIVHPCPSCPVPPLSLPMLSSSAFPALLRPSAGSPEVQAKFVRGSKRYGRRSIPEFTDSFGHLEADCGFDCGPPLGQVRGAAEAQGRAPAAGEDGEAEADHGVDNQGNSKLKVHRKLEVRSSSVLSTCYSHGGYYSAGAHSHTRYVWSQSHLPVNLLR